MSIGARVSRFLSTYRSDEGPLILIYNMGKVGSTSVESGFKRAVHTHTLYGFPPCSEYYKQKFGKAGCFFRKHLVDPLRRFLLKRNKEVYIISFYRDPAARNISMFMQDLPYWMSRYSRKHSGSSREEGYGVLVRSFMEEFPHEYPEQWVEKELGRLTGLSPETLSLGIENYKIINQNQFKIFIGRNEKMDECIEPLVKHFGMNKETVNKNSNRGDEKWYADVYAKFRENVQGSPVPGCEKFKVRNGY